MNSMKHDLPVDLLKLYKHSATNQISGFCDVINQLNPDDLVRAYHRVRESAPSRHARNKLYFVGHSGVTSSGEYSNRREEHLAVALWNASQDGPPMRMPGGDRLRILDYQFPLKASRGDKGVGKVDLFGVIGGVQSCVIELKIHPTGKGLSDTPLRAFIEAFAYCAIVEANASNIANEALKNFDIKLSGSRPALIVMAPEEYWFGYKDHKKTGNWWPELQNLADQLAGSLGLTSHFIAMRNSGFSMGLNGEKPQLVEDCSLIHLADLV
jgi:hypothetical protein